MAKIRQAFFPILIYLLIFVGGSVAANPLVLGPDVSKITMGKYIAVYEDATKKLTIEDVSTFPVSGKFDLSTQDEIGLGYTRSVIWARFTLDNPTQKPIRRYLEQSYSQIDELTLYTSNSDGTFSAIRTGDNRPFDQRPIRHRNFVFNFEFVLTLFLFL